ncbi:MAG: phosphodiester glycosidase family protein [bacterium]
MITIFKKIGNGVLITVIFLLLYSNSSFATFFSDFMEDFIRDGKELNLLVDKGNSNLHLEPINDLLLKRKEDGSYINLEGDQRYIFKVKENPKTIYRLQLFASKEEKRINHFWKLMVEGGYSNLAVIQEDGLYKLRIGFFTNKEDAESFLSELKKDGWNPWIVEDRKLAGDKLCIFNSDGEVIFFGSELTIEGDIVINNDNYQDKILFSLENKRIKIKNKTKLNNIIATIMETQFRDQEVSKEVLKAYAISLRTYILSYLYNVNNTLELEGHGISNREDIIDAVRLTDGIIMEDLQEKKPLDYKTIVLSRNEYLLLSSYDYQKVLNALFGSFSYRDYRKESFLQQLVNAEITWGLRYKEFWEYTWDGPRFITIVEADMNRSFLDIKPVLAQGKVRGLDDLSRMLAMEKNSLVAINGGYFHYSGRPLGVIYHDGELISEAIKNRTALLITEENEVYFNQVSWNGNIDLNSKKIRINGINRIVEENEVILYNHFYDKSAPAIKLGILELVVSGNLVQEVNYTEDERRPAAKTIPEKGYILQIHGAARQKFSDVEVGDKLIIKNKFTPDFQELNIKSAIGAGPLLLKDGEVFITAEQELFQADIAYGRAPRSAVGKTIDNNLVFFTVDGRQVDHSIGISLNELAKLMRDYGVIDGMNLDGGNSARMIVRGFTMNRPSADRFLSNGIVVGIK